MIEHTPERAGKTEESANVSAEATVKATADAKSAEKKKKAEKAASKKKKPSKDAGLTEEEKKLRAEQRKRAARKKRKKIIKTLIIILVVLAVLGFAAYKFWQIKQSEKAATNLTVYTVERRTITEKLSATGTLAPVDSYTVTSKVKGDIIDCFFEEGDEVTKDQILYVIDSDDMNSVKRQNEMSVEKAEKSLSDLEEKRGELSAESDLTGTVTELYVEVGDTIQKGQVIADIIDNSYMLVDIPFHKSDAEKFYVGQLINVTIEGTGERRNGSITKISGFTGTSEFGAPTKEVTVRVKNPGGISTSTRATGDYGDYTSTGSGTFYYNVDEQLKAQYGGEIKTLYIKEDGEVRDGQKIIDFDDEDLNDQIKDAKDSLEKAQMSYDDTIESLGEYEIKAPITGTVVEKGFNKGESIDTTSGNATVAIIYDLSALTFDMSIDELDIFSVEKGQSVEITSDAMTDVFYGEITKISKVGTTSGGTTSYPVTVTITDEAALAKLLPGMNIDAEITVNRVENVISVPTGAVARGNTVKVVKNPDAVKKWQEEQAKEAQKTNNNSSKKTNNSENSKENEDSASKKTPEMPENAPAMPENGAAAPDGAPAMPEKGSLPEGAPAASGESPVASGRTEQRSAVYGNAPAETEYEVVKVETGISDDDFIEIISGLEEGDMVIIESEQVSSVAGFGMMGMGGMPGMGGMTGGGMPGGGNRQGGGMQAGTNRQGGGMPGGR